jgi:hypothetical protein
MDKVREFYAFVVEDPGPQDEAVIVFKAANDRGEMLWLPLATWSKEAIDTLSDLARGVGKQQGKKVILVRFTGRADLKVVTEGRK